MQVIWDVLHYGWPEWVDVFAPEFPREFGKFCRAAARTIASETAGPHWFCVVNEPSFLCWAGAQEGFFPPFVKGRGDDLKKQLIRATIAGIEAIRDEVPGARFLQVDPLVNIVGSPDMPLHLRREAAGYYEAQFQCTDMLVGRLCPELGGHPRYLDVIGCNYYVHNQWEYQGSFIERTDPRYKPFWKMLQHLWQRYRRPLMIAETGIESERRPEWLSYIGDEVETAIRAEVPVQAICLYPVLNHPGWADDRHCHNGLWDYCNADGHREIYSPLAHELRIQQDRFRRVELRKYMIDNTGINKQPQDVICLSHLRWGFVYQRPQHLLSRFARTHRVFFVEEPVPTDGAPSMAIHVCPESGVHIAVPQMPEGLSAATRQTIQKLLLNNLLKEHEVGPFVLWYYTPMALSFSSHLKPALTVFDCMDELSAFKGAPQEMKDREAELMRRADLVFTGGMSLFEAKVGRHGDIHAFPSSIDYSHFAQARTLSEEPEDQASIPHPRVGFAGVIDERMDIDLLGRVAELRPDVHFVMIGPVVKIDPATLPRHANVHYLGGKSYKELPAYVAGWDAAMMPFAHNDSTKYISPTKTPEYLAAGKPVVSTSITDVVRPYGVQRLVRIADDAEAFAAEIDNAMSVDANDPEWAERRDVFLSRNSWDITFRRMRELIESRVFARELSAFATKPGATPPMEPAALGD